MMTTAPSPAAPHPTPAVPLAWKGGREGRWAMWGSGGGLGWGIGVGGANYLVLPAWSFETTPASAASTKWLGSLRWPGPFQGVLEGTLLFCRNHVFQESTQKSNRVYLKGSGRPSDAG